VTPERARRRWQYANAPWTHASFAAKLADLARTANGNGEAAANAALALGNALYNVTWYGNARVILGDTHRRRETRRPRRSGTSALWI
jgi:hypothetical protein